MFSSQFLGAPWRKEVLEIERRDKHDTAIGWKKVLAVKFCIKEKSFYEIHLYIYPGQVPQHWHKTDRQRQLRVEKCRQIKILTFFVMFAAVRA